MYNMISITTIIVLSVIVGVITAGLSIRFDRFFVMLLLLFLAGVAIKDAVNIFLVVILLGALTFLLERKEALRTIPREDRVKFLTLVPVLVAVFSFLGSWLFIGASDAVLILVFGVLTVLYGLRLIVIHFGEHEKGHTAAKPGMRMFCGLAGPMLSGFSVGFIGTSLKSLKIPFAVRFGKMNLPQVYVENAITAAYASLFAIIWRFVFIGTAQIRSVLYGVAIWGIIHAFFDLTEKTFPRRWKKAFQIIIGVVLLAAAVKVFALLLIPG